MHRFGLMGLLTLLVMVPAIAQTNGKQKAPTLEEQRAIAFVIDELRAGYSHGYSVAMEDTGESLKFMTEDGEEVLLLHGIAEKVYNKFNYALGGAYLWRPTRTITHTSRIRIPGFTIKTQVNTATIYRFKGGVIASYRDAAVYVPWSKVTEWETKKGTIAELMALGEGVVQKTAKKIFFVPSTEHPELNCCDCDEQHDLREADPNLRIVNVQ